MIDDQNRDDGAPDSDPRHLDPPGDIAGLFKSDHIHSPLADDADREELKEFVERAEAGEFGDSDSGLEATVRIARALLGERGNDEE